MGKKLSIGEMIENEVRKQGMAIPSFAEKIHCKRNNAYDIFKRNKIDTTQLALISKVLNHNFFEDFAKNMELADINDPEKEKELRNEDAVGQFHDVIIDVLERLDIEPIISFGRPKKLDKDIVLPDFMIDFSDKYKITFTVGDNIKDKAKDTYRNIMSYQTFTNNNGISIDLLTFKIYNIKWIDIKLDFKTEEEWEQTLRFALEKINK